MSDDNNNTTTSNDYACASNNCAHCTNCISIKGQRLVECFCCKKHHPLLPPMIDIGQKYVYYDDCYGKCSYAFSNGQKTYYHGKRVIEINELKLLKFIEKNVKPSLCTDEINDMIDNMEKL